MTSAEDKLRKELKKEALAKVPPGKDDGKALTKILNRIKGDGSNK